MALPIVFDLLGKDQKILALKAEINRLHTVLPRLKREYKQYKKSARPNYGLVEIMEEQLEEGEKKIKRYRKMLAELRKKR